MKEVRREIVSRRVREAVRDHMSGTPLREIDEMWQDELFAPPVDEPEGIGGQRVTRFQGYLGQVDWTDASHVSRGLRVFEVALSFMFSNQNPDWDPTPHIQRLQRLFQRDGLELTPDGKIQWTNKSVALTNESLSDVRDPSAILAHLDRIESAVAREDPEQAIGSAKELVESTAKAVLRERGVNFTDSDDVPRLVKLAAESLHLHPSQQNSPDNSNAIRKILGGAFTLTNGIAELRNKFGTGHGRDARSSGLGARHAALAINGARLWCQFVLDTLSDPKAPWRKESDIGVEDEPRK